MMRLDPIVIGWVLVLIGWVVVGALMAHQDFGWF
jgi:hypothetical protein